MSSRKALRTTKHRRQPEKQLKLPITLRGRRFDPKHIRAIRKCVAEFYSLGRTRISLEVCKALRWRQPNGWPKDRACRDVLIQLARRGMIRLPKRLKIKRPENCSRKKEQRFVFESVTSCDDVRLEFAKGNAVESEWNELVARHHYLGHRIVVGRCLKYLVIYKGLTAGAISFSSASWRVDSRDKILKTLRLSKRQIQNRVINNSRFVLLPAVTVPNLASRVLSIAARQVTHDWKGFYSIEPVVAETFVEVPRFTGASYKAANWRFIGKTKGFRKSGRSHFNSQLPKDVYIFGLNKNIRRKLRRLDSVPTR